MEEKKLEEIKATLHKFHVDFLGCPVIVCIGDTLRDAVIKVDPQYLDEDIDTTLGMTITGDDTPMCFIVLPEDTNINTVVHECTHAVLYIFGHYGITFTGDENEVMAYMMGYFVDCVYDAIEVHAKEKAKRDIEPIKEKKKSKKST